jgi:hypothetical protein
MISFRLIAPQGCDTVPVGCAPSGQGQPAPVRRSESDPEVVDTLETTAADNGGLAIQLPGQNKAPKMAQSGKEIVLPDRNPVPDQLQLALYQEALRRAAGMADVLAVEMECGILGDQGGPEALRLLAAVLRIASADMLAPAGHA